MLMLGTDYPYSEYLPKKTTVVQIDERAFALGRRTAVDAARPTVRPFDRLISESILPE